jgi:hypothetical protein
MKNPGESLRPYDIEGMVYGTQCVYYPRAVIPKLSGMMLAEGVEKPGESCDVIVRQFCRELGALFAGRTSWRSTSATE